jgi:hypothetical protein
MPSDGRYAKFPDRTAHSSLTHLFFPQEVRPDGNADAPFERMAMLEGMSNKGTAELITLAKSWLQAPVAKALSGCEALPYSRARREYPLVAREPSLTFAINADNEHPIDNLSFTVRNWGHKGDAEVLVDGKVPGSLRQGTAVDTDGNYYLVVWVEMQATKPVEVSVRGAMPSGEYTLPDHIADRKMPVVKATPPESEREPVVLEREERTFDGTTVIEFEDVSKIKEAKTMTWSAWVKTGSDGTIMALTGGEKKWIRGGLSLFIRNGTLTVDIGWVGTFKGPGNISDGKWHHVAMTRVANGIHLYLDGNLHSSHHGLLDLSVKDLERFKIGFTNNDFPRPSGFKGQMKNVAVYDYAMTDDMVMKDFKTTGLENQ